MKNNEKRIFKYLSESFSENEKADFEREVAQSEELRNDLAKIQNQLRDFTLNDDMLGDDRYFANLLPKVRERIAEPSTSFLGKKIYYLIPTVSAVFVIMFFVFRPANNLILSSKELSNEVVNNLSDSSVSQNYISVVENEISVVETINEPSINYQDSKEIDESVKEEILRAYDTPNDSDILSVNNLSDDEIKQVYNKISFK